MNTITEIKNIVNNKNIKYDDLKVKFFISRYQKYKVKSDLNKIRVLCYPVILGVIKNVVKENKNMTNRLQTNEELVSEFIFTIDNCAEKFNFKKKVNFVSYLWRALTLRYRRYNQNYKSMVKKSEGKCFIDLEEGVETKLQMDKENKISLIKNEDLESVVTNNEKDFETQNIKEYLFRVLNEKEKQIFIMLLDFKNETQIRKELNMSFKALKKVRNKIQELIGKEFDLC